jgi:hypothetical protein
MVGAGPVVSIMLGCGPQLADEGLASGLYRARHIEVEDVGDVGVCIPNDDGTGQCVRSGFYETLFTDSVPVRTARNRIEIPEPHVVASGDPSGALGSINAWRLRPLREDAASFTSSAVMRAESPSPRCQVVAWSAIALDDEVLFVTREMTPCEGTGAGSVVELEYVLEQVCEPPCAFVDDREQLFPDVELEDDVLLQSTRCAC